MRAVAITCEEIRVEIFESDVSQEHIEGGEVKCRSKESGENWKNARLYEVHLKVRSPCDQISTSYKQKPNTFFVSNHNVESSDALPILYISLLADDSYNFALRLHNCPLTGCSDSASKPTAED